MVSRSVLCPCSVSKLPTAGAIQQDRDLENANLPFLQTWSRSECWRSSSQQRLHGDSCRGASQCSSLGLVPSLCLVLLVLPSVLYRNSIQKAQKAAETEQLNCWPGSRERGQHSSTAGVPLPVLSHALRNLTGSTSWGERGKYPALALETYFCIGSVNYLGV